MIIPRLRATTIVSQTLVYVVAPDAISGVASGARATVEGARCVETLNANITRGCQTLVYVSLTNTITVFLPPFSEFKNFYSPHILALIFSRDIRKMHSKQ